jgi:hypothetical protein
MQSSERQKWNTRHLAGAALAGLWKQIEPRRRHELNDTMVAAAARVDSTAAWFDHVFGRFGVALESCFAEGSERRIDVVIARLNWAVLREAVEENPALLTMIAKEGPLPADMAPEENAADVPKAWTMPVPTGELIPVPSFRTIWTSQSSMSHGADDRHGNVVLFRREPVVDLLTGQTVRCPFISGNSIRHSWRALAVDQLYRLMGVDKKGVHPELHHSLTSGGVIDAGSEMSKVDPALRRAIRELFPAFELFGGIAEKQVCHGAWNVHDATLVCRENASRLMHRSIYPAPAGLEGIEDRAEYAKALATMLRPALSFLTLRQYTKHIDPDVASDADTMHMLWDTEIATAGAQWVHFFSIHPTATDLARSCASAIMAEFQRHPYLAASNAKGHGLVAFDGYASAHGAEPPPSPDLYLQHLEARKADIVQWLTTGKAMPTSAAVLPTKPRGKRR